MEERLCVNERTVSYNNELASSLLGALLNNFLPTASFFAEFQSKFIREKFFLNVLCQITLGLTLFHFPSIGDDLKALLTCPSSGLDSRPPVTLNRLSATKS